MNSWSSTPVAASVPTLTQTLSLGLVVSYTDVCLSGWCCGLFSFVTTESNLLPIIHNGIILLINNNNIECLLCILHFMCIISFKPHDSSHNISKKEILFLRPFSRGENKGYATAFYPLVSK